MVETKTEGEDWTGINTTPKKLYCCSKSARCVASYLLHRHGSGAEAQNILSLPEIPPLRVVLLWRSASIEHTPPPLVNEVAKRKEGDLLQSHLQQVVDISFWKQMMQSIWWWTSDVRCHQKVVWEGIYLHLCHFTIVRGHRVQQSNSVQMFGRGNRQRQNITDGFVETGVGSTTVTHRLVLVLQVILDVTHLMVHSEELLHGHSGALLDSTGGKTSI